MVQTRGMRVTGEKYITAGFDTLKGGVVNNAVVETFLTFRCHTFLDAASKLEMFIGWKITPPGGYPINDKDRESWQSVPGHEARSAGPTVPGGNIYLEHDGPIPHPIEVRWRMDDGVPVHQVWYSVGSVIFAPTDYLRTMGRGLIKSQRFLLFFLDDHPTDYFAEFDLSPVVGPHPVQRVLDACA